MEFINPDKKELVRLKLVRDRTRSIKQGYPWIYSDWLAETPAAAPGSRALVRDKEGNLLAFGIYDPNSPLVMRVVAREEEQLDDTLILHRLESAYNLRSALFPHTTTGFRLLNGEGDGLPGVVCDLYGKHAVIKLDGEGPSGFWNLEGFSKWLIERVRMDMVYLKYRSTATTRGKTLYGTEPLEPVSFIENGFKFRADIVQGQKTGFFFDQRDNRFRIGALAKNRTVLNLFGYTGGFSIYAGVGGAKSVTTVDMAKPAIKAAQSNWLLNELPVDKHTTEAVDVFKYLENARAQKQRWDLIVVDPPSFASAERNVEKAKESYQTLFSASLNCLETGGIIGLSSCSSHITMSSFLEICQASLSKSKRRASVLGIYGQPEDHPFPFACDELRYLKFVSLMVD